MSNAQPHTPPPPTASVQNWNQSTANTFYVVAIVAALAAPGALVGALIAAAMWTLTKEPMVRRISAAAVTAALALVLRTLSPAWLVTLVVDSVLHTSEIPTSVIVHSAIAELLLGPALLVTLQAARMFRYQSPLGLVSLERKAMTRRSNAMLKGFAGSAADPAIADGNAGIAHPPGKIRLGEDESQSPFDIDVAELSQHIAIPGASGTGKTKTLMRLAGGALANEYAVVFIDCKGAGLTRDVTALSERAGVRLRIVDPDNRSTIGYDPCTGDAAHVANKLVGAFTFGGEAEIYKQIAMEVIPVIVRALQASKQKVSLQNIYEALAKGGLTRLGRTPGAEQYLPILQQLEEGGGIGAAGYAGLQHRLGALIQGKFGPLFQRTPRVDWNVVTAEPAVTYFSLSATAASEDVKLFARVLMQDLKQFADSRLRRIENGEQLTPVMVFIDEFAALREMSQITDLLLQARAARMSVGVSSQFLPVEVTIRTPVLQAGVLICHRVGADDSEAIAAEFGTRKVPIPTHQVNYETGISEKGSIRTGQEYNMHPDILRELPIGSAAVYARRTMRRTVVHVYLDQYT